MLPAPIPADDADRLAVLRLLPAEVAARAEELSAELLMEIEPGFEAFVAKARLGITETRAWTYVRRDGSRFPVLLTVSPILDEEGTLSGFLGIARDDTERKRLEATLVQAKEGAEAANRAKSEFLANMGHEIRTPMNAVIGMTELLGDTALDAAQREYLEVVRVSAGGLLEIIDDILDFSKIEAGRLELERESFDPRQVVDQAIRTLAARAQEKGLGLLHRVEDGVPAVLTGDAFRLRQVLINLVGNAIKFTASGEVAVEVAPDPAAGEDLLHFQVRDTGIGISQEQQERIFAPFMQADGSVTRQYGGTGLGLSISSRLVRMMGGRIWVDSEPGRGSTFHFTARFAPARLADAAPEPAPLPDTPAAPARALRILLVEDNAFNQKVVAGYLQNTGHELAIARDGQEAVSRVGQGSFDLVLMDAQMPVMDGLAATRAIRARERATGGHLPVIALTARAMREDEERCRTAGMDGYLSKPLSRDALLRTVVAVAQRSAPTDPVAPAPQAGEGAATLDPKVLAELQALASDGQFSVGEFCDLFLRTSGWRRWACGSRSWGVAARWRRRAGWS